MRPKDNSHRAHEQDVRNGMDGSSRNQQSHKVDTLCFYQLQPIVMRSVSIDPIHAAAMTDKKKGLGGRFTANVCVST